MAEGIRKSGIDIIGDIPWGTHLCQFYKTKEDLIDILVPFFKAGLENNEFCMWITSDPLNVEDAKSALKSALVNLDDYIEKGQIEILDASQWYIKSGAFDADHVLEGWIEKEKEALKNGYEGLRLNGNTFWLEKDDWKKFTDYEEIVNKVIGNYQMLGICSYSLDKCDASKVIEVVANHQFAIIMHEGEWGQIQSSEHKLAEEIEELYIKDLKYLSETAMGFMELAPDTDIYQYIAENIEKLVGNSIVIINSFDPETDLTCVRAIVGMGKLSKSALKILGKDPVGITYKINEVARHQLLTGKYHKVPGKMHELSFRQMPKLVCNTLEKLFGIREIHSMGFTWRGELFGNVVIILRDDTELKNTKLAEAFINQAAVALQRKQAEEALQRSSQQWISTFNAINNSVCLIDVNGKILQCNEATSKLLASPIDDIVGRQCWKLMHGTSGPIKGCPAVRVRKTLRRETMELSWDDKTFNVLVDPLLDSDDNLIGFVHILSDITELKRVEEERGRAKTLEDAIDAIPDAVLVFDVDGMCTYTNPQYPNMFGLEQEDFVGKYIMEIKGMEYQKPEEIEKFMSLFSETFENGRAGPKDVIIVAADGREIPVNMAGGMIKDTQGNPKSLIAVVRDVTERKQMEEELKKHRDHLEELVKERTTDLTKANEQLQHEIIVRKGVEEDIRHRLKFEKTISNISSQIVKAMDFDEAINFSLADLGRMSHASRAYLFTLREGDAIMDNTHEWCAKGVTPQIDNLKEVPSDMFPWWMEKLHNGEVIHIKDVSKMPTEAKSEKEILKSQDIKSLLVLPINIKRNLAGFIGFNNVVETGKWSDTDLALLRTSSEIIGNTLERMQVGEALQENEEKYRSLFENMLDGFAYCKMIFDKNEKPIDFVYLEVNNSFERLMGLKKEDLVGKKGTVAIPTIRDTHPELFDIYGKVVQTGKEAKFDIYFEPLDIWLSISVYCPKKGYFVAVFDNITERKKAEEELLQSKKLASIGMLAAGVAHEINNPLTNISILTANTLKMSSDPEIKKSMDDVLKQIERATNIVKSLLMFSHKIKPNFESMNLNKAISDSLALHEESRPQKVTINTDFIPDLPPIKADFIQLQQVFGNIIKNAYDAIPTGGTLTLSTELKNDKFVETRITDTGVGISKGDIEKIFDPFFTKKGIAEGVGLGLSICHGIVEAHNGTIEVESEKGKGTTFIITLPVG